MIVLGDDAVAQIGDLVTQDKNTPRRRPIGDAPLGANHVPITKWVRVTNTTPVTVAGTQYYHGATTWFDNNTGMWHDVDDIWLMEPGGTSLSSTSTHYLAQYVGPQSGSGGDGVAVWAVVVSGGSGYTGTISITYVDATSCAVKTLSIVVLNGDIQSWSVT